VVPDRSDRQLAVDEPLAGENFHAHVEEGGPCLVAPQDAYGQPGPQTRAVVEGQGDEAAPTRTAVNRSPGVAQAGHGPCGPPRRDEAAPVGTLRVPGARRGLPRRRRAGRAVGTMR
jgi:hypothetical protein